MAQITNLMIDPFISLKRGQADFLLPQFCNDHFGI